ncbi:MAG TPA: BlaI/MecI/CopY family transcriptional regulator [Streptosporangiaceae bacterium]
MGAPNPAWQPGESGRAGRGGRSGDEPPRRGPGELAAAVLQVLWDTGRALSPAEVQAALVARHGEASRLSYSTVVTILSRLHAKKALVRRRAGRAFRYSPAADEAGLAARRLAAMLDREPDRDAVLSRFVAELSERDEQLLRSLLRDSGPEAS